MGRGWKIRIGVIGALGMLLALNTVLVDEEAESASAFDDYTSEKPLDRRMASTGKPLLVLMGNEEQIIDDTAAALAEYRVAVPGARTRLIAGAGHSPNVEKPALTAGLLLAFATAPARP
jgi:pimeloyl-ACP methyl ester carboxylesterase